MFLIFFTINFAVTTKLNIFLYINFLIIQKIYTTTILVISFRLKKFLQIYYIRMNVFCLNRIILFNNWLTSKVFLKKHYDQSSDTFVEINQIVKIHFGLNKVHPTCGSITKIGILQVPHFLSVFPST